MILILLPVIGAAGIILGITMYGVDTEPKMKILSIYNAYTQFTYLVLIYSFISTFCNDFTNGSYSFMKQIGYGLRNNLITKSLILFVVNVVIIDIIFLIMNLIFQNHDYKYLFASIATVDLCIIVTLLLAMLLSVIVKKTMMATLIAYGLYVVMNVLNFVGYGIFNPADGNSISSVCLQVLAGLYTGHYTLGELEIPYEKIGYLISMAAPVIWSLILLIFVAIFIRRAERAERKK